MKFFRTVDLQQPDGQARADQRLLLVPGRPRPHEIRDPLAAPRVVRALRGFRPHRNSISGHHFAFNPNGPEWPVASLQQFGGLAGDPGAGGESAFRRQHDNGRVHAALHAEIDGPRGFPPVRSSAENPRFRIGRAGARATSR